MSHHDEFSHYPPLRDNWDPDNDEHMGIAADAMDMEHSIQDIPTHAITLIRGDFDQMQVRAFAAARLIVFTQPRIALAPGAEPVGSVREQHVGSKHMASAETFRAYFEQHVSTMVRTGWKIA